MREKLIELLKRGGEAFPISMADHLIANGVTLADNNVGKWIPVTEQQPKKRGRYLVSYTFKGSGMRFYGEAIWHDDLQGNGIVEGKHFSNEGVAGMYVTHWMEMPKLPEPPKEE